MQTETLLEAPASISTEPPSAHVDKSLTHNLRIGGMVAGAYLGALAGEAAFLSNPHYASLPTGELIEQAINIMSVRIAAGGAFGFVVTPTALNVVPRVVNSLPRMAEFFRRRHE